MSIKSFVVTQSTLSNVISSSQKLIKIKFLMVHDRFFSHPVFNGSEDTLGQMTLNECNKREYKLFQ